MRQPPQRGGPEGGWQVHAITDDNIPTADELEQLAQSLAIDGSLGRADALRVVEVLRALAAARRSDQSV